MNFCGVLNSYAGLKFHSPHALRVHLEIDIIRYRKRTDCVHIISRFYDALNTVDGNGDEKNRTAISDRVWDHGDPFLRRTE